MDTFCSHFQKECFIGSPISCAALLQSAEDNSVPDTSNGGPNVEFRAFGADLANFEMTKLPCNWVCSKTLTKNHLFGNFVISSAVRSTPSGKILTFDPPFDAPGSVFSSAL